MDINNSIMLCCGSVGNLTQKQNDITYNFPTSFKRPPQVVVATSHTRVFSGRAQCSKTSFHFTTGYVDASTGTTTALSTSFIAVG